MSNNIFIDLTEEMVNKGWTVNWEFNAIDPTLFLKYNHCTTYTQCREVDTNVATDVDGDGAWNYRLDNLETGGIDDEGLFMIDTSTPNTSLVSFNVDLPNLTDGNAMFGNCTGLTSFSSALPKLTNGYAMFIGSALTSWDIDLPSLTNGFFMFGNCSSLTSFSGDLSSLTNGFFMFLGCTNLSSFSSDLSALTDGSGMFGYNTSTCTKLGLAHVQKIAETINDLTLTETTGYIHIGIASALQSDDETAPINVALADIVAKGWEVSVMYA